MELPIHKLMAYEDYANHISKNVLRTVSAPYEEEVQKFLLENQDLQQWRNERGTAWAKRFKTAWFKEKKEKPDTELANRLARSIQTYLGESVYLDISDQAPVPGKWSFEDDYYCWATYEEHEGRDAFFSSGHGYAVRFYTDEKEYKRNPLKGISRMWLWDAGEFLVEFNHKGKLKAGFMMKAFANVMGLEYRQLEKLSVLRHSLYFYIDTSFNSFGFAKSQDLIPSMYTMDWRPNVNPQP